MPTLNMVKTDGAPAGEITLCDEIFGAEVNAAVLHQVVVAQLAAARQGTQSALGRSEVRGGGIKPWRQKGTGRARQGSIRAPQWTHGGVVFPPKPRTYNQKVNKKVKRLAMASAFSLKVSEQSLIVIDDLTLEAPKTKEMIKVLKAVKAEGKVMIITEGVCAPVVRAAANIPTVVTAPSGAISVYDIMNCDTLVMSAAAVKAVEEVYAG